MPGFIVHAFADYLEAVSIVETTANRIVFEYVELELVPKAEAMIHKCPAETSPLMIRIDEKAAYFRADQSHKTHQVVVDREDPGFGFGQIPRNDGLALLGEKVFTEKRMRDLRRPVPDVEESVDVAITKRANHLCSRFHVPGSNETMLKPTGRAFDSGRPQLTRFSQETWIPAPKGAPNT